MHSAWAVAFFSIGSALAQSYPAPARVFSNTFGGRSGSDAATALAVDPSGNVAVVGNTSSPDFPVTHAYLPNPPRLPLIAISANGVSNPSLGAALDVTAMASTADGSVVYSASDSGIFRSGDGGATWTQQLPGLAGASTIAVDGGDSNTVYAVLPNNTINVVVGIFKSIDGGRNWVKVTSLPYLIFSFQAALRCPAQLAGTIYATDNGFYRSRDGGITWTAIGPHNDNVFSFALAPSDPNVVYAVASDGYVYRSGDGGDTWMAPGGMFTPYPNVNANLYVYAIAVDPRNENAVWALTATGNLYRSTDGGATFSIVLSDPAEQPAIFLALSPSGKNIIVCGRTNAVVSYNGGVSWNRVITGVYVNAILAGQNAFFIETYTGTQGFLTKWSADGSRMIFSTFLDSEPGAVAADAAGNTFVATQNLIKFSPDGDLIFSESLGALSGTAMTVDSSGNVYLAATPANGGVNIDQCGTAQGFAPTILKFDPQGNLIFSKQVTQTCGNASSIAVDSSGAIYLLGNLFAASLTPTATAIEPVAPVKSQPGFLAVLSPQADQLTYLSYVPGPAYSIALDGAGNVYAAGTAMNPIPLTPASSFTGAACSGSTPPAFGFVIKLSLSSPSPLWFDEFAGGCTFPTSVSQVAVDSKGNVWAGLQTASGLFPTLAPFEVQGVDQGYVAELSADGSKLLMSSFAPSRFALGPQQTLYLAGSSSPNPPKVNTGSGPPPTLAVVEKIDVSGLQPAVIDSISGVQLAADDLGTQLLGIAPGEMIRISGRGLGPSSDLVAQLDSTGRVATSLGGISVLFDGVAAPLIGIEPTSITCMTPFEVSGKTSTKVQIEQNGVATPGVLVGIKEVSFTPAVLTVANQNGTFNSQSNPAHPGQSVTFYVTGFGATNPSVSDGSIYQSPLPAPAYPLNSLEYQNVTYFGPAPGFVAGIFQVNFRVPSAAASGASLQQVSLVSSFMIGGNAAQTAASIWVAP